MRRALFVLIGALCTLPMAARADVLSCAAATHLARRGDYTNGNSSAIDQDVWEWEIGSGTTYNNVEGISADGMFYATRSIGDPSYAEGAFGTVNLLVGRYGANSTLVPYSQDVEAMEDACEFDPALYDAESLTSNQSYCTLATLNFARVVAKWPDPSDDADHYVDTRLSLSGWDAGAAARSAWRAGYSSYAQGIVQQMLDRRGDWENVLYGGFDYTDISRAALVRVILQMHAAHVISPSLYTEGLSIVDQLIATQAADGSWAGGDPQATAYALLALRSDAPQGLPWYQAVVKANNFLRTTATAEPTCGWGDPTEYGETNSEVISALSVYQSLPFGDGFETGDTMPWSAAENDPSASFAAKAAGAAILAAPAVDARPPARPDAP